MAWLVHAKTQRLRLSRKGSHGIAELPPREYGLMGRRTLASSSNQWQPFTIAAGNCSSITPYQCNAPNDAPNDAPTVAPQQAQQAAQDAPERKYRYPEEWQPFACRDWQRHLAFHNYSCLSHSRTSRKSWRKSTRLRGYGPRLTTIGRKRLAISFL
jgi:hypothetical protein